MENLLTEKERRENTYDDQKVISDVKLRRLYYSLIQMTEGKNQSTQITFPHNHRRDDTNFRKPWARTSASSVQPVVNGQRAVLLRHMAGTCDNLVQTHCSVFLYRIFHTCHISVSCCCSPGSAFFHLKSLAPACKFGTLLSHAHDFSTVDFLTIDLIWYFMGQDRKPLRVRQVREPRANE